jgi:hypothetical protein
MRIRITRSNVALAVVVLVVLLLILIGRFLPVVR